MNEEEIKYCKWLNILVFIKNSIALICFTTLAIIFKHWWIVFFAILFISNVKFKKENKMSEDKKIEQLIAHNVKSITISKSKYNRLKQETKNLIKLNDIKLNFEEEK